MNQSLLAQVLVEIVNVFNREGVSVEPQPVIESVHVTTMPFRLLQAGKAKVGVAKNMAETLESAIGLSPIRISRRNGLVNVELPMGNSKRIYCERLPVATQPMTVKIGLDTSNELITHDFKMYPHLAFVGKTNFGKTTNAKSVIWQLLQQNPDMEVYITCYKPEDWQQFEGAATIVEGEENMLAVLRSASALMKHRGANRLKTPTVLIVMDDATQFVENEEIVKELAHLAPLCRGMGILLMPILQRLSGLDSRFTGNLSAKCMFSVASAQDAALLSGHGGTGAELLSKPGDALYVTDGNPTRYAALSLRDSTKIANRAHGSLLQVCNAANGDASDAENGEFEALSSRCKEANTRLATLLQNVDVLLQKTEVKGKPKTQAEIDFIKAVFELTGGNVTRTTRYIYGSVGSNYSSYIKLACGLTTQGDDSNEQQFSINIAQLQPA